MKEFNKKIQEKFSEMCKTGSLFRVELTGRQVWDLYLGAFEDGDDPIFIDPESSTHNCNHCKNFIRRYGNIVSVDSDFNIVSIFGVEVEGIYNPVAKALNKAITGSQISEVFFETFDELNSLPYEKCTKNSSKFQLGIQKNTKRYTQEEADMYPNRVEPNEIREFNHLNLSIDSYFIDKSGRSVESIMADYRSAKEVFQKSMEEIPLGTLELVRDLIIQGSLLNGETHKHKIEKFIPFKKAYDDLPAKSRNSWCWKTSFGLSIAKFKNELIGVLCSELAMGEEINKACRSWNKRVDPANYMKAVAPITKAQIEMAKKFVEENDYVESFNRRTATIDDIKVTEIKHINVGEGKIKAVSIFDNVKAGKKHQHKRNEFDKVEEVSIDKFMEEILPGCTDVEAFLENRHSNNMVTLTTAETEESKRIFKWDNNYSWTFNGNLAGKSEIKEAVKSQGGGVDGILRFSIMWAEDDIDNSDLDAHCLEPNRNEIYYGNKKSWTTMGVLDIDITQPQSHKRGGRKVVENITYPVMNKMLDGTYKFFVRQYAGRNSKGFKAEIEFDGQTYSYEYDRKVTGNVHVAEVTLKRGNFSIEHKLPETGYSSKEIYGLESGSFHKVNLVCLSPNHWDGNKEGNKHYFFMLNKCKAESKLRSFHNENLKPELAEHRKVLEVLGSTNMIETEGEQLSGLGFNSTVRDELVVKLGGNFKRTVKVKF